MNRTLTPIDFPPFAHPRGGSIPGSWDVLPSSPKGSAKAQDAAQWAARRKRARRDLAATLHAVRTEGGRLARAGRA